VVACVVWFAINAMAKRRTRTTESYETLLQAVKTLEAVVTRSLDREIHEATALAYMRDELAAIRVTLAERELELVDLRRQLVAFEGGYMVQRASPLGHFQSWFDDRPVEEVRKDAERGGAKQQYSLAFRYGVGAGVARDLGEEAQWYRKAAEQGYAPAQLGLGVMYDAGQDVAQDYVEAAQWYRRAADQGLAEAQFGLGVMYDTGHGVAQDYVEAVQWYRRAADQGLAEAQFNLGLKYNNGQGVAQDYTEAAKWYRKAADQGFSTAQFNLGLRYVNGKGVVQDCVQAHVWTNLAAAHANDDDGRRYASIRDRVAAKMNDTQIADAQRFAACWYRKAAEQGSIVAQLHLGLLYERGEGVVQDYIQAHLWMNLAAAQSHSERYANAARERVAAKMNPLQIAEAQRLADGWKRIHATQDDSRQSRPVDEPEDHKTIKT
jgi:TPR repeat protein